MKRQIGDGRGPRSYPVSFSADFMPQEDKAQNPVINYEKQFTDRSKAAMSLLSHRTNDETLDVSGTLLNPTATANIVTYTAQTGSIAKISELAVVFSNPFMAMLGVVGWRIVIQGSQPPYVSPFVYSSIGDVFSPMAISPLWVQSNMTIALQVVITPVPFGEHLVVMGRISGKIFKPASPQLIPGEE